MSQNEPKPAETTQKKIAKRHEMTQIWGYLEFFTNFRFSHFEPKLPNLGILGQEVSTF